MAFFTSVVSKPLQKCLRWHCRLSFSWKYSQSGSHGSTSLSTLFRFVFAEVFVFVAESRNLGRLRCDRRGRPRHYHSALLWPRLPHWLIPSIRRPKVPYSNPSSSSPGTPSYMRKSPTVNILWYFWMPAQHFFDTIMFHFSFPCIRIWYVHIPENSAVDCIHIFASLLIVYQLISKELSFNLMLVIILYFIFVIILFHICHHQSSNAGAWKIDGWSEPGGWSLMPQEVTVSLLMMPWCQTSIAQCQFWPRTKKQLFLLKLYLSRV